MNVNLETRAGWRSNLICSWSAFCLWVKNKRRESIGSVSLLWPAVWEKCLNFQQIHSYQVRSNLCCRWKKTCVLEQDIPLTAEEKATDRSGYHKPGWFSLVAGMKVQTGRESWKSSEQRSWSTWCIDLSHLIHVVELLGLCNISLTCVGALTVLFSQSAFQILKLELFMGCQVSNTLPKAASWDNPNEAVPTGTDIRGDIENHWIQVIVLEEFAIAWTTG